MLSLLSEKRIRVLHIVEGTSVDGPGLRTSIYLAGWPDGTRDLIHRIKSELGYNVWCFTGYRWEEIVADPELMTVVQELDVLVDGPFVLAERDISLHFRGSRNQRLIDVQATLSSDDPVTPVLWSHAS